MATTNTHRHHDGGFTLIEMLLVILLLGILAAIALFGADAFGSRAREACSDTNARLERAVEDATSLGVPADTFDFYVVEPGDCDALGGFEISAIGLRPLIVAGDTTTMLANHGGDRHG